MLILIILDKFFSVLVLPEFSLNLPDFPSKFARIQGDNCPPCHPVSYTYVDQYFLVKGKTFKETSLQPMNVSLVAGIVF